MERIRESPSGTPDTANIAKQNTPRIANQHPIAITLCADEAAGEDVKRSCTMQEGQALERLVHLKSKLSSSSTEMFWPALMKGITGILGAQYSLCSKLLPRDGEATAVQNSLSREMAPLTKGVAFFAGNGPMERHLKGFSISSMDELLAESGPEGRLRVPRQISEFVNCQAAEMEVPVAVSLGVPLSADGICFAHICAFWSEAGERERRLSWGFVEMTLRALEDMIVRRLTNVPDSRWSKDPKASAHVLPKSLAVAVQSLQPYARSLSHELRTPMHGVVGMLDIMHATVQEALEAPPNDGVAQIFHALRENIEAVQDSSRRAVEAADNVVHAYDLNMQVPDTPDPPRDDETNRTEAVSPRTLPEPQMPASTGVKRRRSSSMDPMDQKPSPKYRAIDIMQSRSLTPHTVSLRSVVQESGQIIGVSEPSRAPKVDADLPLPSPSTPGGKVTRVRDLIHLVVNESLRFGGRPDSAIATETETGEMIEVRNRSSSGEASTKIVEWAVHESVPDDISIDERDFTKLISVLFLNALKFTDQGSVMLRATVSPRSRYLVINVTDTGSGIPEAFRPYLFKAFSRGDDSLTRQNEGLGLGLMVAKGVARRVGGDLVCLRSDTEGSLRGCEFELRVPLMPTSDSVSRPSTPSRTPTPLATDWSRTAGVPETKGLNAGEAIPPASDAAHVEDAAHAQPTLVPDTHLSSPSRRTDVRYKVSTPRRRSHVKPVSFDRKLAQKYPLNLMVAEDNRINRKLLVIMLGKLGYMGVHEAFDGTEAVRLMEMNSRKPVDQHIDVILMDLWMPNMDGYEAAERILAMQRLRKTEGKLVRILAITADVTDVALDRAREVGMLGCMTKPYKLMDLERLIVEHYAVEAS